jgi:hypothetical protein
VSPFLQSGGLAKLVDGDMADRGHRPDAVGDQQEVQLREALAQGLEAGRLVLDAEGRYALKRAGA